jgi:hypothetical protein
MSPSRGRFAAAEAERFVARGMVTLLVPQAISSTRAGFERSNSNLRCHLE